MILPLSIPSPDVQSFSIGPLTIHYYALCILVGVVLAWIWTAKRLGRRGGDRDAVLDFVVWALVLGIIGARLYHVVTHWGDYFGQGLGPLETLLEVVAVWKGGIAIFGALLGGALGVLIASRTTGVRFWSFADALVPGLLLAQAFGRLGNWINNELFGGPTTLPWGLEISSTNAAFPVGLPEGTLFHPTFLYEIVWNVLGIVILLAIERRWKPRWGTFFALYLIWYGLGRAWVESLRVDPSLLILGMRTNVAAALAAVVLGIIIFFIQRHRHPGIETSVYRPGRTNPLDDTLSETADPDAYYHVIDRGANGSAASESEETAARAEEATQAAKEGAAAEPVTPEK